MGGSLLRAMAFGKPCIVQGEHGYFEMLDPTTARAFRWRGFYGIGAGGTGEDRLVDLLDRLLGDPAMRCEQASFALDLVRRHYGLEKAVEQQMAWYRRVLAEHVAADAREMARTVALVGAWFAGRALRRTQGKAKTDFFNSTEHIAAGIRGPVPTTFDPDLPDDRVPGEGPYRGDAGETRATRGASVASLATALASWGPIGGVGW